MSAIVSQITGVSIVCSTFCSGADQGKHQSPASLAFATGFHRSPLGSPHKGTVTREMFLFDDVIVIGKYFTNGLWPDNPNLKITCRSHVRNNYPIGSVICACHDSWTVTQCAKLWPDCIIWIKGRVKEVSVMSSSTVCEIGPLFYFVFSCPLSYTSPVR